MVRRGRERERTRRTEEEEEQEEKKVKFLQKTETIEGQQGLKSTIINSALLLLGSRSESEAFLPSCVTLTGTHLKHIVTGSPGLRSANHISGQSVNGWDEM